MPAESPQPTPLQAREVSQRKACTPTDSAVARRLAAEFDAIAAASGGDSISDGLDALYEWSSSCERDDMASIQEDRTSPKPARPKPFRARLRRCYHWVVNLGLLLLLRAMSAALACSTLAWAGTQTWCRFMRVPDWPEVDSASEMPPECAGRHAQLQAAGLDPALRNISLPPWEPAPAGPAAGHRATIAYLGSCGFLQRLGIVVRVFAHLYRKEDLFLYQADPDSGVHDPLVEVLASRFGGGLPENVRVRLMPHTGRVFYWGHTANVLAALQELLLTKHSWQWLVRLHDSAYPMHAPEYMRSYLEAQPGTNFMDLKPWMELHWMSGKLDLVHACGPWVGRVERQRFPQEELERNGFTWAMGDEWWVITRSLAAYFVDPRLRPFYQLMQHRVNVEEIFWASIVSNIPGFAQIVAESLVWCIFSGADDWRDAKHSPDNIVDARLDTYFGEIKRRWPDSFFVRKVRMGRSDDLMRWLDSGIERERLYYGGAPPESHTGRQGTAVRWAASLLLPSVTNWTGHP